MTGGGQLALGSGFLEELVGLVAAGFGVGEDGGERGPGRVGEDSLGVVGDGCSYVAGQKPEPDGEEKPDAESVPDDADPLGGIREINSPSAHAPLTQTAPDEESEAE